VQVYAGRREKKIIIIVINRPTTTTTTTHGVSYTGLGGTAAARLERIKSIWSLRAAAAAAAVAPYSPAQRARRRSVYVRQSSSAKLPTTAIAAACSPPLTTHAHHTYTIASSLSRSLDPSHLLAHSHTRAQHARPTAL